MLHASLTRLSSEPGTAVPPSWVIEPPLVNPSTPIRHITPSVPASVSDATKALSALAISRRNAVQLFTLCSFVLLVQLSWSLRHELKRARAAVAAGEEPTGTYWLKRGEWRRNLAVIGFAFFVTACCLVVKAVTAYIGRGVWSDMSPSDIVIATLFYQFCIYVCVRLARRGFTLGEMGIVTHAGTALFMETVNMTRTKVSDTSGGVVRKGVVHLDERVPLCVSCTLSAALSAANSRVDEFSAWTCSQSELASVCSCPSSECSRSLSAAATSSSVVYRKQLLLEAAVPPAQSTVIPQVQPSIECSRPSSAVALQVQLSLECCCPSSAVVSRVQLSLEYSCLSCAVVLQMQPLSGRSSLSTSITRTRLSSRTTLSPLQLPPRLRKLTPDPLLPNRVHQNLPPPHAPANLPTLPNPRLATDRLPPLSTTLPIPATRSTTRTPPAISPRKSPTPATPSSGVLRRRPFNRGRSRRFLGLVVSKPSQSVALDATIPPARIAGLDASSADLVLGSPGLILSSGVAAPVVPRPQA